MQKRRQPTIHDSRYKNVIKVLIRARKEAGLSQSDLATRIGFTQPDISKIERLERRLDITEFLDAIQAITNGDRSLSDQIWEEVKKCHR